MNQLCRMITSKYYESSLDKGYLPTCLHFHINKLVFLLITSLLDSCGGGGGGLSKYVIKKRNVELIQ